MGDEAQLTPLGHLAKKGWDEFNKKKGEKSGLSDLGMLDLVILVDVLKRQQPGQRVDAMIKLFEAEIERRDRR